MDIEVVTISVATTINVAAIYGLFRMLGWKLGLRSTVICLIFIIGSFIPMMGIPGMLAMFPAELWSYLIFDTSIMEVFDGDKAWPAALYVTALINVALLPLFSLTTWKFGHLPTRSKRILFLGIVFFWASWCPVIVLWLEQRGQL